MTHTLSISTFFAFVALFSSELGCRERLVALDPQPSKATIAPAKHDVNAEPRAAADASAPEVYVGAVGALPVRATLIVTPARIEGRWVYERGGDPQGLRLEAATDPSRRTTYALQEKTDSGEVSGQIFLDAQGALLRGVWRHPRTQQELDIVLTREVRSRRGDSVVRARRIIIPLASPPGTALPGFLPVVEGPGAAQMQAQLTLERLLGEKERELGDGTTGLDFEVRHHDDRLVTLFVHEETMGAYPSGHGRTVTFDYRTARRLGADVFRPAAIPDLVRLLDARMHASWRAAKQEYLKGPTSQSSCGPDVVRDFMAGDGPSFTPGMLGGVFVEAGGIDFAGGEEGRRGSGAGFPHVVLACEPHADLHLGWAEARPFLAGDGPLHGY